MADLITEQPVSNDSLIYSNLQNVKSDGLELELKAQLPHGLEGIASYSFQETKDADTDQFLNNSPRNLAKLNLVQPLLRDRLFLSLDAQYRSRIESVSDTSVSPFSVVNCTLLGRKIGKQLDLSASVYNLLNKRYSDPGSGDNLQSAIPQDGRSFRVKMTWHLGER
jgi:iron complex outermembrane receptor protein